MLFEYIYCHEMTLDIRSIFNLRDFYSNCICMGGFDFYQIDFSTWYHYSNLTVVRGTFLQEIFLCTPTNNGLMLMSFHTNEFTPF